MFQKLKSKKRIVVIAVVTLIVVVIALFYAFKPTSILGISFTWTQGTWTTETADSTAAHPDDKDNFTTYDSKDTYLNAGTEITMTSLVTNEEETDYTDLNDATADKTNIYVDDNAGDGTLSPQRANTYACESNDDNICQSGRCDTTCQAQLADGQACDEDSDCTGGSCSGSLCTTPVDPTYIFVTAASTDGAISTGGRVGADAFCNADANKPVGATNVHAFLSVNTSSEIRDLPTLYGYESTGEVYWHNASNSVDTLMANNWTDLLDGTILANQQAGTGISIAVWTASCLDGSIIYRWEDTVAKTSGFTCGVTHSCIGTCYWMNCQGWTSSSIGDYARRSAATTTTAGWLNTASSQCNTSSLRLFCAYQ